MEVAADSPDPLARREMTEELKRLAGMRRPSGAGSAKARAAGLLQWLEPRAAGGEVRDAGEYGEDLAAPQHDGNPGVPRTLEVPWVEVCWTLDDGLQRRPYRARRGICARHTRCRRAGAGRDHDVRRQGLHGNGPGVGVQARGSEPDGRVGRAAARGLGQDQNRDRAFRAAGAAGASRRPATGRIRSAFEPAPAVDTSNVIRLSARARRWRNVATFTSAIAAALVAMIAVGAYQPDLLPDGLRPKPRTQVVEVRTPPARRRRLPSMSPSCRRREVRLLSFSRSTARPGISRFARSAPPPRPARVSSSG